MRRKSRTIMLIIMMAFICVTLPFSLSFGRREAESGDPDGKTALADSFSGCELSGERADKAVRREMKSPRLPEVSRVRPGAGRGQQLPWICAPLPAAVFVYLHRRRTAPRRPGDCFPARFLCDLFILYQKDGKKREPALLPM